LVAKGVTIPGLCHLGLEVKAFALGGWPTIANLFKIKASRKNKHNHMLNIPALFLRDNEEFGGKCILGQPPRGEGGAKAG